VTAKNRKLTGSVKRRAQGGDDTHLKELSLPPIGPSGKMSAIETRNGSVVKRSQDLNYETNEQVKHQLNIASNEMSLKSIKPL
jgi:hypothetical protein